MSSSPQQPWWDQFPPMAHIESRAQSSGEMKDLQEHAAAVLGRLTPADTKVIEQRLGNLSAYLAKARTQVDGLTASMADHKLRLLRAELSKTGEAESPSAATITQAGDWLLDNVPALADPLVRMFADPAIAKVLVLAGPSAIAWAQQRLGGAEAELRPMRSSSSLRI